MISARTTKATNFGSVKLVSCAARSDVFGIRGSVPTPVADNLGFSGNIASLTIRYADQPLLIFDAGTGIHLFLTHFHLSDAILRNFAYPASSISRRPDRLSSRKKFASSLPVFLSCWRENERLLPAVGDNRT
jgi:hypothetical protein